VGLVTTERPESNRETRQKSLAAQVFDIPETVTKEQLIEELERQNHTNSVPENFVGKMFKFGRRNEEQTRTEYG
jgi:hypothetical protein